jgi:hypothetical protein
MDANKKWLAIPKDIRDQLRKNVFCGHCTEIWLQLIVLRLKTINLELS